MTRQPLLAGLTFLAAFLQAHVGQAQPADVPSAFDSVMEADRSLLFESGDTLVPDRGHWQGIQLRFDAGRNCHWGFLTHDSASTAYLYVVEFPAALDQPGRVAHLHEFPSDGDAPPLRHSGGFQLAGDVLAVGVEDNQEKTRSEVQLWDVTDPLHLRYLSHLTVHRRGDVKTQTAGAVGLAEVQGRHVLAVANWDSREIDFYATNSRPLMDPECCWTFKRRWSVASADRSNWSPNSDSGSFQSIQLVADAEGQLFLVGFQSTRDDKDLADLFIVNLEVPPEKTLCKVASRSLTLGDGCHFRFAAGLWIVGDRIRFLASERTLQPLTQLKITP